jgi:hypothetical protein
LNIPLTQRISHFYAPFCGTSCGHL